jgi:hypothetical protein
MSPFFTKAKGATKIERELDPNDPDDLYILKGILNDSEVEFHIETKIFIHNRNQLKQLFLNEFDLVSMEYQFWRQILKDYYDH